MLHHFRWPPGQAAAAVEATREERAKEEHQGHLLPSLKLAAAVVSEQSNLQRQLRATTDNIAPQLFNNKLEGRRKCPPAGPFAKLNLKRIILALASLKLTTSATSSTSGTPPSAGLCASLNSIVSVLLRTLLIGCYYAIAFSSLALIILYINNHVSWWPAPSSSSSWSASVGLAANGSSLAATRQLLVLEVTETPLAPSQLHQLTRIKRSYAPSSEARAGPRRAAPTAGQRQPPKLKPEPAIRALEPSIKVPLINERRASWKGRAGSGDSLVGSSRPPATPGNKPPPSRLLSPQPSEASNELTERHASYSTNNRGTAARGPAELAPAASQADQGQWIPIVNRVGLVNSHVHQRTRLQQQARPPLPAPVVVRRPEMAAAPTTSLELAEGAYLPLEEPSQRAPPPPNHRPRNFRQRPPAPIRHWRRPRLQSQPFAESAGSKMYKRVLLCDKTLVSLDYVRNLGAEPRPMMHFDFNDDDFNGLDTENAIELESRLRPALASLSDRVSNFTADALLPAETSNGADLATRESAGELDRRYSFLTDEDPLVKCDMWDLEKGLKNRKPPVEVLRQAIRADFDTVRDAINRCRQLSEKTLPSEENDQFRDGLEIMSTEDLVSLFSIKRGLIPGTKWCGLGDIAHSYNDLGPKHRIDICCRAHDHCPIRLKPFRNDYGVLNIALYTKSHCDCDADFYRCLREVHSRTADMLGNLYFNVMKLQCMKEERMKICREVRPLALGFERCVRYEEGPNSKRVFKFTTPPVAY